MPPASPPSAAKPVVSVVTTFYNEEEVLPEFLRRVESVMDRMAVEYEILCVNDSSMDASLSLVTEAHKRNPRIKLLNTSRRFGVDPCYVTGIGHAAGEAVIIIDADLQDPPELIPDLVARWKNGADVVYTVRESRAGEPRMKLWLTRWAYRVLRWVTDIELPEEAGNYRLMSRRAVDHLLSLDEKDPYLRGLTTWIGFRQEPVPYHREPRFAGSTHFFFAGRAPIMAFLIGLASFSFFPLLVSLILGALTFACAMGFLAYVAVWSLAGGTVTGVTVLTVLVLLLGGSQLIILGVIGLYLGLVFRQVKKRPICIIESALGIDVQGPLH